jgi:hypothetical protein
VRLETLRYQSTRDRQDALRQRLRALAAVRVRFGYRRLTVLLKREGWRVNAKRIYRLYGDEELSAPEAQEAIGQSATRTPADGDATHRAAELRQRQARRWPLVSDAHREPRESTAINETGIELEIAVAS